MTLRLLSALTLVSAITLVLSAHIKPRSCTPFQITFASSQSGYTIVQPSTYDISSAGLEMLLDKPSGKITQMKDGTNSQVAEGATVNSTFSFLYGKVTYEMSAPEVSGVVTAAILVSASSSVHEEIDVEVLGSQPQSFQSNIFVQAPQDKEPLYGVFGGTGNITGSIADFHRYSIDWNEDRIVWSVDGKDIRTMNAGDTNYKGVMHYPTHPMRLQLGIWDASSPQGTSEWAGGPIKWDDQSGHIKAVVRSMVLECP